MIFRYFFFLMIGMFALGSFYCFALLPVVLSIMGPPSELVPFENVERILPPTPPPSERRSSRSGSRAYRAKIRPCDADDLSTIYEESQSYRSSHEIIVQPELVVETTTITNAHGASTYTTSANLHQSYSPSESLPEVKK